MLTAEQYLNLIHQRGQAEKPLKRVYSNMLRIDLFLQAYGNIYANKGAMTPGVDGDNPDGMSIRKLQNILQVLREGKYRWLPARRTYIPKDPSNKRPLGIVAWSDKIVQEVIRMILEAYYEPQFSFRSHGFRPGRGCHTALKAVSTTRGVKWFIEGDLEKCFDKIDHDILLSIIGRQIQDPKFLRLIAGMLKAGYLEEWTWHKTYSGTPQGSIVSPILSNIYLNELDRWIDKVLIPEFTNKAHRAKNLAYKRLEGQYRYHRNKGHRELAKELDRRRRKLPSKDMQDPEYLRLWYVRYADDVLLMFIGPREMAVAIKARVANFLDQELNLTLSDVKTRITRASKDKARFLGYDIWFPLPPSRKYANAPYLEIPRDVRNKWIAKYSTKNKPEQITARINNTVVEIVRQYDAELRGYYQYYKYAHNVCRMYSIKYVMMQSLVKTLANKLRTKTRTIYKRYNATGETKGLQAVTPEGIEASFGLISMKRHKKFAEIQDRLPKQFGTKTELERRLLKGDCEIPSCEALGEEVHHIKSIKSLKQRWAGRTEPPSWTQQMIARNRKTLVVCREHHRQIHNGTYDGPSFRR